MFSKPSRMNPNSLIAQVLLVYLRLARGDGLGSRWGSTLSKTRKLREKHKDHSTILVHNGKENFEEIVKYK